jgi:hypothetical protein
VKTKNEEIFGSEGSLKMLLTEALRLQEKVKIMNKHRVESF